MKRCISCLLILCLLGLLLAGCAKNGTDSTPSEGPELSAAVTENTPTPAPTPTPLPKPTGDLVLYCWPGSFPQTVLDEFTRETGYQISCLSYDYDETMLLQLQSSEGGIYDVVLTDDYIMESVIAKGLARQLEASELLNGKNIDPRFQGQYFDPKDQYTVPWGAAVQTILYNPETAGMEIGSYGDLWNEALAKQIGITANSRVIDGVALKTLGKPFNEEDPEAISQAGEKLLELVPNVGQLGDGEFGEALTTGKLAAAVMYSAQAAQARRDDSRLRVVFPKEGIGFGLQELFVPSQAPHLDAALAFLDYLLQPEVSAKCFEHMGCCSTNREANSLTTEESWRFLALPEDVAKADMELIRSVSAEALAEHEKIWNRFRAACIETPKTEEGSETESGTESEAEPEPEE